MIRCIRSFLSNQLLQNIAALFVVQFSNYALQLLTVPYLARVLGPGGWGVLAVAQAFAQYSSFVIDYGFDFSATRETARLRDSPERLAGLFSGVLGVRIVLTGFVILLTILVQNVVSILANQSRLLCAALAWGITVGFTPNWYFQGMEKMGRIAALDIGGKVISSIGIIFFVKAPGDGWKMLAIQAAVCALVTALNMREVYRQIPFRVPTIRLTLDVFNLGKTMFLYRSSTVLNSVGNTFVLGLVALPQVVGYYSGAERVMKAFIFAIWPINQAFYPRMSRLHHHRDADIARIAKLSAAVMGVAGFLFGSLAFGFAPLLVHLLLGKAFEPSILTLRVLAMVIPLTAINFFLGMQNMLPRGMDKAFNWITSGSAVVNLVLAFSLASRFAQNGVAAAVVGAQVFSTLGFSLCLWWYRNVSRSSAHGNKQLQSDDSPQEVYS